MFEPSGQRIYVSHATTVLDAARSLGLPIPTDCGGHGTCGKCRIKFQPAPFPTQRDLQHLSKDELAEGIRLACEHVIETDTRVVLPFPEEQAKILVWGSSKAAVQKLDKGLVGQLGVAIDLGTTTIVAYLMDLGTGSQIEQQAMLNPEVAYGEDIMTRMAYVMNAHEGGEELRQCVLRGIDVLLTRLISAAGVLPDTVSRISLVGNTAMHHLFLGLDIHGLSLAPYRPAMLKSLTKSSDEIGLKSVPKAQVYVAPNIEGFIGSDTVGLIVSQGLGSVKGTVMGIDIGTNAEIVLSVRGRLICCSAAAGPAFEGARIRLGMRGEEGAIEHVRINNPSEPAELSVIGQASPRGICGSAIVDIVAELLRTGLVDRTGRMRDSKRIVHEGGYGLCYIVAEPGESDAGRRIVFTQEDVRQVQLAKAAIATGAGVLMDECGVTSYDIDALLLAGAFGNYIRPESALAIGLLPAIPLDRIVPVGNAAGEGAKRFLLSLKERAVAETLSRSVKYVNLAAHPAFADRFLEATAIGQAGDGSNHSHVRIANHTSNP